MMTEGMTKMLNFDNSYARLPQAFFSHTDPVPVRSPKLVIFNQSLAKLLGLDGDWLQSEEGVSVLAGNRVPEGAEPIAQAYAGHQFGHLTMLGDGRAVLRGEQLTPSGERFDIQLKGSGQTPYSRRGDGRAALGPMLREYLISEAMYALGIPTTRSLAVVSTGETVWRETGLAGAVLTRVAASHLRVGTSEYAAGRGNIHDLRALADYTLKRHFSDIQTDANQYYALLLEVIKRQAKLIANWQLAGFIHGVMNTDNMALSGETIDYGPCAFIDTYDTKTVFSSIDIHGRYAYGNQPYIGQWNLARFAESLLPLLHKKESEAIEMANDAIGVFPKLYERHWLSGMRAKLGLFNEEPEDDSLIENLLGLMQQHKADYTNTFIALTFGTAKDMPLFDTSEFTQWQEQWTKRRGRQQESEAASQELMRRHNPAVIPRNHRVEDALEAAVKRDDFSVMEKLLRVLSEPYAHTREQAEYSAPPLPSSCQYRTFCGT